MASFVLHHLLSYSIFSALTLSLHWKAMIGPKMIDRLHCIMDLGYEEFTVRYNPLGYTI